MIIGESPQVGFKGQHSCRFNHRKPRKVMGR